jgi:2-haloacid dehalogenase
MGERRASFDCYGTLIDWDTGISDAVSALWPSAQRNDLLTAYHRLEPRVQAETPRPYQEVLAACTRALAGELGLPLAPDDDETLPTSLPQWPPFPDVPGALRRLRADGWRLAVLSNTDPDLLTASLGRIGVRVDHIVTVADTGSYKPALGHWRSFQTANGASPERWVHVAASLFHDIAPCAAMACGRCGSTAKARSATSPAQPTCPTARTCPRPSPASCRPEERSGRPQLLDEPALAVDELRQPAAQLKAGVDQGDQRP